MVLTRVEFDYESVATPGEIVEFLRTIQEVVECHRTNTGSSVRGFVPGDYAAIYRCLRFVYDSQLLCGERFCEWGSGISVVASLAAKIGYDSYGIEYDGELCVVGEAISEAFGVSVEIVNGSYIPAGVEDLIDEAYSDHHGELSLHTDSDLAYEDLGYEIQDFDLIFAYPWPNDVELTHKIFDRCAARGAMLLVYYDTNAISLFRKD